LRASITQPDGRKSAKWLIFVLFRLNLSALLPESGSRAARTLKRAATGEQKVKFRSLAYFGIAVAYASHAYAGCGHATVSSNLSVLMPDARAQLRDASPGAEADASASGITGLWLVNVTIGGQLAYQAFESFTSDGLETLNDNGAPQAGNVCLGVWIATSHNSLKIYHPSWNYDSNGNVIGTVIIKSQIVLDPGGNTYKGLVTIDVFDLNGNSVAPTTKGQLTARRITAN
jgi:hypothetical protein